MLEGNQSNQLTTQPTQPGHTRGWEHDYVQT